MLNQNYCGTRHKHKYSVVSKYNSYKLSNNITRMYMAKSGGSVYDTNGVRCEMCGMYFPKEEMHTDTDHKYACHLCLLRHSQMQCEICGKFILGDSPVSADAFVIYSEGANLIVCKDCCFGEARGTQRGSGYLLYEILNDASNLNQRFPKRFISEIVQKYESFQTKMQQELKIFENELMDENGYHVGLIDNFDVKQKSKFNNGKEQAISHITYYS